MKLSTGREVYGYGEIFGIGPDGETYGGYDDLWIDVGLTPAEKMELAEIMLDRWKKYKDAARMALAKKMTDGMTGDQP